MAPFPQNRSCGRETPCKSSFPLWHGRPVHRLHRRDNENRKGKRGLLSMRPQGHTAPAGELFCSLSMTGSLLHGRPCFCTGLRCGSSGRASAEFSILPPPRHPPAGKKGGTGALSTCIIPKCAPLVKKKEGRTAVLPPSYAPARRDIQGPRFSPAAPKVGLSGKCPAGASLMPGCAGWRPAPPPPAPDGSGSGPEWPPPAYGGLRG